MSSRPRDSHSSSPRGASRGCRRWRTACAATTTYADEVVACDSATEGAVERLCAEIRRRGLAIDALVNNAGFGAAGGYTSPSWDVHENMLQVMVVAASELTYWLLPGMIERRYGRIVNVASVGGLVHAGTGTLETARPRAT